MPRLGVTSEVVFWPAPDSDVPLRFVGVVYNLHYRANQLLRDCMHKGVT